MRIGQRIIDLSFLLDSRHYLSLFNIFRFCEMPLDFFRRYFFAKGSYPVAIPLRTPIGRLSPTIYYYDDSLTVNEIFFRHDYGNDRSAGVFLDIGGNIGLSALFFLTRNTFGRGYIYEPVPENLLKLENNLASFRDRITVVPEAVYTISGTRRFGVEETGRLGGLSRDFAEQIEVQCVSINEVLEKILKKEERIDILKVDIEGDEIDVVRAIDNKFLARLGTIYFDIDYTLKLDSDFSIFPDYFLEGRYGNTYVMKNKAERPPK